MALPPLREELSLMPGPLLADGQTSKTLHDPSRNQFFQLDWPTFEILKHWHLGDPEEIAVAIGNETTLHLDAEDVIAVVTFLDQNQLLQPTPGKAGELAKRARMQRGKFGQWLLHNYLFFRIPVLKPDQWLDRWASHLDWLYRQPFWYATAAALTFGLIEIYRDWERFATTLVDSFTIAGLLSYGIALVTVKLCHELGHAITAKRFGCRVPTMGIAFLVLWPMAYTDTNDVWRLTSRKMRLMVAAAGILTELTIAAWATLAWVLLPEGIPKSVAFMMATVTWISSIAINASPFMRFDGYFLLSDWLEMPNLHARAFALARWDLRERLFALNEPVPEVLTPRRHLGIVLFAYATWLYRLVVFLGIAALVYAFFIKAVGIFLFLVEIVWFVLLPPFREIRSWMQRWPLIRNSLRAKRTAIIAVGVCMLMIVPWPNRILSTGMLRPSQHFVVYAPSHATLGAFTVSEGEHINADTPLLKLESSELESRLRAVQAKLDRLRWQASAGGFDSEQRAQWQVAQRSVETSEAELASIKADAIRYAPTAPFAGVLRDIDPDIRPGEWLSPQEPLARLIDSRSLQVVTFLNEEEVSQVAIGDRAQFYSDGLDGPVLPLEIERIDTDATHVLTDGELAIPYGGSIAVREKKGALYPEQAIFRVTLKVQGDAGSLANHSWRGRVVIGGAWTPPAWRFVRSALSLFWREAGF